MEINKISNEFYKGVLEQKERVMRHFLDTYFGVDNWDINFVAANTNNFMMEEHQSYDDNTKQFIYKYNDIEIGRFRERTVWENLSVEVIIDGVYPIFKP